MMMQCDTLLMIGSSFPYSEFLPKPGQARGVQVDHDARMIGIRYPMDVHLVGDAANTLRELLPHLKRKSDRSWRDSLEKEIEDWWKVVETRAMQPADPLNPQRVFWELSPRLPDDCILSAKFAYPDRPAIALVGDGAMQMNGLAELITIRKYWERWSDPRLIVLVLHNNDLNQVTWEMRVLEGDPRFAASQDIPEFPYARFAEMLGLRGIRVNSPDAVGAAWDEALAADRPVVLEAITDPEVPPLPPHISFAQARGMLSALLRGDPASAEIVRQSFRGKLAEFFPQRGD